MNLNSVAEDILSLLSNESWSGHSSTVASSEYKLRTTVPQFSVLNVFKSSFRIIGYKSILFYFFGLIIPFG